MVLFYVFNNYSMEIETALHTLVTKRMAEEKVIKDTLKCKANLPNFTEQH